MSKSGLGKAKKILRALFGPTDFTSKGTTLPEVIIALLILIITALAAASFFTNQLSATRGFTRKSACKAALDSQLSYFRQTPSGLNALPWIHPDGSTMQAKTVQTNYSWFADSVVATPVAQKDLAPLAPSGGRELQTHYLQLGSMGLLAALYHNVPGICSSPVDFASIPKKGSTLLPAQIDEAQLPGFSASIQIVPYHLATGDDLPGCPQKWPRPQGSMDAQLNSITPKLVSFPTNTDPHMGFRVKLKGEFDTANGKEKCDAEEDFRYAVDRLAPKRPSVIINAIDPNVNAGSVKPANASSGVRSQCTHTPNAYAELNLEIGFNPHPDIGRIEPGSLFFCRDVSEQMNPDYCKGAPLAAMNGASHNASAAQWVPCNEVTVCGIKPASAKFEQTPLGDQKYVLKYSTGTGGLSPSSPSYSPGSNDGLWGCDIRTDVATVDPSGNFIQLSTATLPVGYKEIAKRYFQPVECWACYKKKSNLLAAIVKMAVVVVIAGIGGGLIFCASGASKLCKPKGTKFIGHACKPIYGTSGKRFCKKLPPKWPAWFTQQQKAAKMTSSIVCQAKTKIYANSNLTYTLEEAPFDYVVEDSVIDHASGQYCEAQAVCGSNGEFQALENEDGSPGEIESCGRIVTEKRLDISSLSVGSPAPTSGSDQCVVYVPNGVNVDLPDVSSYSGFEVCSPAQTGEPTNTLCRKMGATIQFPTDARTGDPDNKDPNNYRYYDSTTPVDPSLLPCQQ